MRFVQDQYLPYVQSYKRSWKTDETVLRIHVLPKLGRLYLDEITPNSISALMVGMRDAGYAPGTIGRAVVILRYLFNLARKWKALPSGHNPASDVPIPPDVQRNRFLSKDEISRLVEALRSDENQVAAKSVLLLLLTGARRNEVTYLRWQHVDLQGSTFLVPLSKSGRPRYVVLNREACALLRSIRRSANNEYVFPSPVTGRPSASLHFPWKRIRARAGLPDVRLHDLRHSFASVLVNKKVNLYDVQRLLGHANAKATQRYSHLSNETLTKAADVMGDLLEPLLRKDARSEDEDRAN
jgi:integrase